MLAEDNNCFCRIFLKFVQYMYTCICISLILLFQKGIKTEDEYISVMEITKPFKNKPGGKFNGKLICIVCPYVWK